MSAGDVATRLAPAPQTVEMTATIAGDFVGRWWTLADEVECSSYFQTPDWVRAWWDTVAGRPPTTITMWSERDGALRALVGLSRVRVRVDPRVPVSLPVTVNAGSGPGDGDHCGPLVRAGLGQRDDLAAWLRGAAARSTLLLRNVDEHCDSQLDSEFRLLATTPCPRLQIEDASRPVACSANFRRQLSRDERELRRDGVDFDWIPTGAVDDSLIAALWHLHMRRRNDLGRGSSLDDRYRALLEALAHAATPRHGPAAVVARRGGVVGVVVGFRWKNTFSAYQSGWDPTYTSSSLGKVLIHRAIHLAAADGVQTFDFLRGTEAYKYRFGATDTYDRSYVLVRNASGHAFTIEHAIRGRLQPIKRSRASARTDHRAGRPR